MTARAGRGLRAGVLALMGAGLVLPIGAGLWQTAATAFGRLPAADGTGAGLFDPWARLWAQPGLFTSVSLSLWTGLAATILSFALAVALTGAIFQTREGVDRVRPWLAPILAAPHAALAIGLGFLIAPSGWIARAISPWATGWTLPPDLATVNDPLGLALIVGLTIKELPFLTLVIIAAAGQIPLGHHLRAARALGHGPAAAWAFAILPQLYPLIHLPIFVVLAFSLSVVDMAVILGPSNPPVLAVAMTRWFQSGDLGLFAPASAAALLQAALVLGAILIWMLGERLAAMLARAALWSGIAFRPAQPLLTLACGAAWVLLATGLAALAVLVLWSFAQRWTFPDAVPESWSLRLWLDPGEGWGRVALRTGLIGLAATALSLVTAILWLEGEARGHLPRARWAEGLIYAPLLIPQVAFLFGLNVFFLRIGLGGDLLAVIWVHVLFTFPYVMLALTEAWRAVDPRLLRSAAALGAGPWRQLLTVRLPVLTGPILTAAAIGFAVSVAQYLPTLFAGAGRVTTLTTEAVTLSSGGDRRLAGLLGVLQAILPLAAYGLALAIPAFLWRNRRGLRGA